jgi:hypothetical protein
LSFSAAFEALTHSICRIGTAKAAFNLGQLSARLKSCPFKTAVQLSFPQPLKPSLILFARIGTTEAAFNLGSYRHD